MVGMRVNLRRVFCGSSVQMTRPQWVFARAFGERTARHIVARASEKSWGPPRELCESKWMFLLKIGGF